MYAESLSNLTETHVVILGEEENSYTVSRDVDEIKRPSTRYVIEWPPRING